MEKKITIALDHLGQLQDTLLKRQRRSSSLNESVAGVIKATVNAWTMNTLTDADGRPYEDKRSML